MLGGPPVTLTEFPSPILGASWGTNDQIIFGTLDSGLVRVSGGGGEPEVLTTPDTEQGETLHMWPSIISNREAVVFVIVTSIPLTTGQLAVLDVGSGDVTRLGLAGTSPHYVPTGHLIFATPDGSVRGVPFDPVSLEVTGSPVPLVESVVVKPSGAANFSVSDNGRLVYVPGAGLAQRSVVLVDRQGREQRLTGLESGAYQSVRRSPDGHRLALDVNSERLWTYDIARGVRNPLTTETGVTDLNPLWTPDGTRVVFSRNNRLMWTSADGTGAPEQLLTRNGAGQLVAESWAPDGRLLFTSVGGGRGPADIEILSMEGDRTAEALIQTDQVEGHPMVSPDERWMAYHLPWCTTPLRAESLP